MLITNTMNETEILNALVDEYNTRKGNIDVKMPDGAIIKIQAFEYTDNHEDCEWFFVMDPEHVFSDNESLAVLAKRFAAYEERKARLEHNLQILAEDRRKLAAISDKSSDEYRSLYQIYSDSYKSIHGFRPHCVI